MPAYPRLDLCDVGAKLRPSAGDRRPSASRLVATVLKCINGGGYAIHFVDSREGPRSFI